MGSSLGVSILGAVYAHHLTASLAAASAGSGSTVSASSMTPAALRALPEAARHVFQEAVTSGISALFMWGSAVAAVGIIVALFVRHVPLRGGKPAAENASVAATAPIEGDLVDAAV
jgi:hypothetical protein